MLKIVHTMKASLVWLLVLSGCGGDTDQPDPVAQDTGQVDQVEMFELVGQCGDFTSTGLDAGTYTMFMATTEGAEIDSVSVHLAFAVDGVDAREAHVLPLQGSEDDTKDWKVELLAAGSLADQVNDESSAGAIADGWTDRVYVGYNAEGEVCACEPGSTNYGAIDCG